MFTPLTEYKKNIVSISAFGGLNRKDMPNPGEWHDMLNISDKYAPLLAPRRSRERLTTLYGHLKNVIFKNNKYYYTTENGIYCEQELIQEESSAYNFIEIGNKIIALSEEGDNQYVIEGDNCTKTNISLFFKPKIALNNPLLYDITGYKWHNNKAVYDTETTAAAGTYEVVLESKNNGLYDAAAESLLNIGFTYATINEDDSIYLLHAKQQKYIPQSVNFSKSRFFLGSDNLFYRYDKDSGAATEITSPAIAIVMHKGCQNSGTDYPELEAGEYIKFSCAESLNPCQINRLSENEASSDNLCQDKVLRVIRTIEFNVSDPWYPEGWEYAIIVDYDANFVKTLKEKDLIFKCSPYTQETSGTDLTDTDDIGRQQYYPKEIKIEKSIPNLLAILESNNRIWAANCENNEIKASAQGNAFNWDEYRGLVSDSYAVSVGSDGAFTASCVLDEAIYFFKENSFTMVYGTRPSNFCTHTANDFIGISIGGAESLQVIGKSAYYIGTDGRFYRFNGQSSVCISAALGDDRYTVQSSAHSAEKYFALADNDEKKQILVYNTATGMWYIEDAEGIDRILNIRTKPCALCPMTEKVGEIEIDKTEILLLDKWTVPETENNDVCWQCESGLLGLESDYYQFISNLKITFESEVGAVIDVLAKFDNDAGYTPLAHFVSERKGTRSEKIKVNRCEYMRLLIRGVGFSKIIRISYMTEQGSEK